MSNIAAMSQAHRYRAAAGAARAAGSDDGRAAVFGAGSTHAPIGGSAAQSSNTPSKPSTRSWISI